MILFAAIYRLIDGLPLSATTDNRHDNNFQACQRHIKMLSRKFTQFQDRCTLSLEGYKIHFISSLDLTFLTLVMESYPTVLSFCFLDEIQQEFLLQYDRSKISNMKRPYALIEFDTFLQRTKSRFNNPRTLTTRINLSEMSQEIKLRPPYHITEDDLKEKTQFQRNYSNGVLFHAKPVGPGWNLAPVTWVGYLSSAVNMFCGLLNLMRGMTIINHGHFDAQDSGAYTYGALFLFTSLLYMLQTYTIFSINRRRRLIGGVCLFLSCICHYLLSDLRNTLQMIFYTATNLFSYCVILSRHNSKKPPGVNI